MIKDSKNNFLATAGLLRSYPVTAFQANLGRRCNLNCNHCHLSASPQSTEVMTWEVMENIVRVIDSSGITRIDITGGAPEFNPNLRRFIDSLSETGIIIQLRTNLVALLEPQQKSLAEYFSKKRVNLVASLPCYDEANVHAQRGDNVFECSIAALKLLNRLGYGTAKGPKLDLVYNPGGPFLPGKQGELEINYRHELRKRYGIVFNNLLTLTNMPIGRFKSMLSQSRQLADYLGLLQCAYRRENLSGLMCRSQVSIGWNGTLYDCDFNLALNSPSKVEKAHIAFFNRHSFDNRLIVTGNHCFGCTAGAGSSCSGALEASE